MHAPAEAAPLIDTLKSRMPSVLRWAGQIAKQLRQHDVAIESKGTGNVNTDALTLADLSLQDMLVCALRDVGATGCRIEAEEETGPLDAFADDSPLTIALDPIDGTKQYRDRTADGYAVMMLLRTDDDVLYSLTYLPEMGPQGHWVEVDSLAGTIKSVPDDWSRAADPHLAEADTVDPESRGRGRGVYLIGFRELDDPRAGEVTASGLNGYGPQQMPGSIYPLLADGDFCGSLIHTPNVYDFPVSLQIARLLGGDAIRVDNGERVDFRDTWLDDRSGMIRLKGVVACSPEPGVVETLRGISEDWDPERYPA